MIMQKPYKSLYQHRRGLKQVNNLSNLMAYAGGLIKQHKNELSAFSSLIIGMFNDLLEDHKAITEIVTGLCIVSYFVKGDSGR
jgi:hypothetical protein